jgi:hypothetical protein
LAADGHGGDSVTGGREPSLALENPSQIPSPPSSSRTWRPDQRPGGRAALAAGARHDDPLAHGRSARPRRKASRRRP